MTEDRRSGIRNDVAQGVADGFKLLAKDEEAMKAFWARGWRELSEHATNNTSRWIGQRLLTWFVIAAVSAGVAWLVKSGAIK